MTKAERNERVATEIREWMLDNEIWIDTRIYFNGKAYGTRDENHNYFYNDRNHLVVLENMNPLDYFEYVNPETISMSFEGPLYDVLNYCGGGYTDKLEREFSEILAKYGLYYELGNAWNLTCGEL